MKPIRHNTITVRAAAGLTLAAIACGCQAPGVSSPAPAAEPPNFVSLGPPVQDDPRDWPATRYAPEAAGTLHGPTYVTDPPLGDDAIDPNLATRIVWRYDEALSGARAENWSGDNAAAALTDPFEAAAEVGLMPLRAVVEPPWSLQSAD